MTAPRRILGLPTFLFFLIVTVAFGYSAGKDLAQRDNARDRAAAETRTQG